MGETTKVGSAESYFVKDGYEIRPEPSYFADVSAGVVYQPDVYPEVRRLATRLGSTKIVDVGCGSGQKLIELWPDFDVTGLDFGENISHARARYPFATWIEHDLETELPLPLSGEQLFGSVLVAADVIEHLVRPEFLLRKLRAALDRADAIVLSTPDRDLIRGASDVGPPPNECHVREWTMAELEAFLAFEGFHHRSLGLTRSWDRTPERHTILALLFPDSSRLDAAISEKRAR